MKPSTLAVVAAFAAGSTVALAAERSVSQRGKAFSETSITVTKGDTLVFVNDDTVTHNVFSSSAGNEFDLGAQAPGIATPVTFSKAGEVNVLCAIHPRMRMTVKITD